MAPYFGMRGGWLTFWVSVACSTDMALFGYDQGVFGGVNVTQDYLDTLGLTATGSLLATITAIYDIGSFLGAVWAFDLGERLGRKKTILVGSAFMTIGCILQTTAFSPAQMIVARIVSGIGNGLNTATAPVWQAETSKADMRGKLVVVEMVCNIAGYSLSNWVTYGMSFVGGAVSWRFPIAFQMLFIIALFATVPWLPESPRWLIAHGRVNEAEQIIADLEDLDVNDPWVHTESKEIQWAAQVERENGIPFKDLLRGRTGNQKGTSVIRRLLLGAGTQFMQQFSGINVTSYYLPTVLEQSVGLSNNLARLLAACNSVSYLIFGSIAIFFVEKWGRRWMMMIGAAGQCFCYIIITVCIRYTEKVGYPQASQEKIAEASIAFFFLYYAFFGFSFQGIPWLYPTEINSTAMRTRGAAIGTATNWIVNFIVVEITPPGIASLHWKFYLIWLIFNASFIPLIYLFYPETSGRTLEDMDAYFASNPPILVFRDKESTSSKRPQRYIDNHEDAYRRNSSTIAQGANDVELAAVKAGGHPIGGGARGDERAGEGSSQDAASSTVVDTMDHAAANKRK